MAVMVEEVCGDVVYVVGNRGSRVALVRVWRAGAATPLLSRAQVTHMLCPADSAARTGAALAAVLAAEADSDDEEEWTPAHHAADTVRACSRRASRGQLPEGPERSSARCFRRRASTYAHDERAARAA